MSSKSELIRTPYQIIDDYLFDNLKIKSDLNNFNDLIIMILFINLQMKLRSYINKILL